MTVKRWAMDELRRFTAAAIQRAVRRVTTASPSRQRIDVFMEWEGGGGQLRVEVRRRFFRPVLDVQYSETGPEIEPAGRADWH